MGNECSMSNSRGGNNKIRRKMVTNSITSSAIAMTPSSILSEKDVNLLRETYETIKTTEDLRKQLAIDAVQMIVARVPEAVQIGNNNTRVGNNGNFEESQDKKVPPTLMKHGLLFIEGLEQALVLVDNPPMLRQHFVRLAKFHRQKCAVSTYMMIEAVDSFESVIISYLQTVHCHRSASQASSSIASSQLAALSTLEDGKDNGILISNNRAGTHKSGSNGTTVNTNSNSTTGSIHLEESCQVCGTWGRFLGLVRTLIGAAIAEASEHGGDNKPAVD